MEIEQRKVELYNADEGGLHEADGYSCSICKNKGDVAVLQEYPAGCWTMKIRECKCMDVRRSIQRMKKSGLKNIIKDYTFDKFETTEAWQKTIKDAAVGYAKEPSGWFFIGGQSGCVDADTEYFDGKRWRRIAEYAGGCVLQYDPETKEATLTEPKRYIAVPSEMLYKISTMRGSIDQVLSADHNFAYITSKGHMQKKSFREVMRLHEENTQGFYGKVETAFSYGGGGIDLTDREIRLMCAVMADGYFREKLRQCTVRVKKERKKERLRELLDGMDYKEYKCSDGFSQFRFYAPRREKVFSEYWYGCSKRQLAVIAEEVFYWDGSIDAKNRHSYFSTEKESADFVQFALAATGRRATISTDHHKEKTCYSVMATMGRSTVSMVSTGGRTKAKISEYEPTDGKQYCFEVETGYLVLRRNGRIFITGNSGKSHICTAICREFLLSGQTVRYMLWRDDIVKIKAVANDAEEYSKLVDPFKKAPVLYIDDLFKTGKGPDGHKQQPTAADVNVAFEIINYRYNNPHLLTLVSSECTADDLLNIDEATAGRILERAKVFSLNPDMKRNYRLRNVVKI